jgi:hypothetical protein
VAERLTEHEYFKKVKELASQVCDEALEEGWLSYLPDPPDATPLQQAINELVRNLRHVHDDEDGYLDEIE